MMKLLRVIGFASAAAVAASCGSDNTILNPGGGTGTAQVATVEVIVSSPQLPSDVARGSNVDITATVKDASNAVIEKAVVGFTSSSGSITVTQGTTDANGIAKAKITNGADVSSRTITITATSGRVSGSATVDVVGTTLKITGPSALAQSDSATYTIVLQDSKGIGVANKAVAISSANTLSTNSVLTGVGGDGSFLLTATAAGADTVQASALGITSTVALNVSDDLFAFSAPAAAANINLGAAQNITVRWTKGGAPQVGQTISFSSTRGTLSAGSAVTDGNGDATVTVTATTAGPATLTASNPENTSTSRAVEFVATQVSAVDVQAEPFTVASGSQSTITAIVRDPIGNLVKGRTVTFTLTDTTGGSLSVASDVTDSQGVAKTFYTGGSSTSQLTGVTITAAVQGTAVQGSVNLTVGGQALFFALGTGNKLFEVTTASYAQEWDILATDVTGAAQANKNLQVGIRSVTFRLGQLGKVTDLVTNTTGWAVTGKLDCPDEDINNNGILDTNPPEDTNGNGLIEAGNIALVAAVPDSAPADDPCTTAGVAGRAANVTTNSQGRARVCVFWPQNYSLWLDTRITVSASVAGTESTKNQLFRLPESAQKLSTTTADPPSVFSPFGPFTGTETCATPPP